MTRRHLIVRVVVPALTTVAVIAPAASAMPMRDATQATQMHRSERLVDAAAHAATMRAIGARRAARRCA